MNAFIRHKLTLTEDEPTIKHTGKESLPIPPIQHRIARTDLQILTGLHDRWVRLLNSVDETACRVASFIPKAINATRWRITYGLRLAQPHHSAQIEWLKTNACKSNTDQIAGEQSSMSTRVFFASSLVSSPA